MMSLIKQTTYKQEVSDGAVVVGYILSHINMLMGACNQF